MEKMEKRDYDKLKELIKKYEGKSHLFASGMFRANKDVAGYIASDISMLILINDENERYNDSKR